MNEKNDAVTDQLPDRLCTDPKSPYYNEAVLSRDVGIRFKGVEKNQCRGILRQRRLGARDRRRRQGSLWQSAYHQGSWPGRAVFPRQGLIGMSVRIVDIREITKPISSPIRNAYIDFTKMTTSLVAVVTDVMRDGKRVVGYGFNSNGRYGQGGSDPRTLRAAPARKPTRKRCSMRPAIISIRTRSGRHLMSNEKPGGHGERSVAVGTIDMAVWDAVAKIAGLAAVPVAGRAPPTHRQSPRIRLCRRRLLLSRQGSDRRCAARCAAISIAVTTSSR